MGCPEEDQGVVEEEEAEVKWGPEERAVHERDDGLCVNCGRAACLFHEVIFRSQGGKRMRQNMVSLCWDCHTLEAHGPEAKVYRAKFQEYLLLCYNVRG